MKTITLNKSGGYSKKPLNKREKDSLDAARQEIVSCGKFDVKSVLSGALDWSHISVIEVGSNFIFSANKNRL